MMSYCTLVVMHSSASVCIFFFFFQAEDGIRDLTVTGVQTCALPISRGEDFDKRWQQATVGWEARAAPLKGVGVVVIHRDQAYLCNWLGMKELASIEPKPGVPPSAGYLVELVTKLAATPPKMILRNAYNDPRAAEWLSERIHAPVVLLPYSVGGTPEAKDLFGLFDDTINRLRATLK